MYSLSNCLHYCCAKLLFQMSRCSFQVPSSCFQITTYLPVSITWSSALLRVYWPISIAVSPCCSTSTMSSLAFLIPISITPCQKASMACLPFDKVGSCRQQHPVVGVEVGHASGVTSSEGQFKTVIGSTDYCVNVHGLCRHSVLRVLSAFKCYQLFAVYFVLIFQMVPPCLALLEAKHQNMWCEFFFAKHTFYCR